VTSVNDRVVGNTLLEIADPDRQFHGITPFVTIHVLQLVERSALCRHCNPEK